MGIGNIGWTEFLVILAIALIFFGPRRLPGIAQAIGRSLREFQKALNEVKSEIAQAGREADVRTGAPYSPRDPLNLLPKLSDTTPSGTAAPGSPSHGPDPDPSEPASGLARETEMTTTPRVPRRDAGEGAPPVKEDGEAAEGEDGDAGDNDRR